MTEDPLPAPPPASTVGVCYRHPTQRTGVHCTRCGRPICPECMIAAPVGFHCPECVEGARREFRQGPGRTVRGGVLATKVLLASILGMYLVELLLGGTDSLLGAPSGRELIDLGAMQPFLIANGQFWRLISAMFLHAGLLHLAFNAYALWLIGSMIETNLGRTLMVVIYFVTGFLASTVSYAFSPVETIGVGASGAIFGIFGAFIAYNYRRRHLAAAAANLRWAWTLILLNLLLVFGFGGSIDWRAHVGGLVAGLAAGAVAEGWGTPAQRRVVQVAGFVVLVAIGAAIVVWRTAAIRALPFFEEGVAFFSG